MVSNILANGTDLDSIFETRTGTKIADVNIQVAGTDISNRYEDIASGSAASATNILTGGNDLNTKFAAIGTVGGSWEPLATNTATSSGGVSTLSVGLNFGNESGSNRMLIFVVLSEGATPRTHTSATYDGTSLTQIGSSTINADGGTAVSMSFWRMMESQLPSTSGSKTFGISYGGLQQGHNVCAILWADVNQSAPVGTTLQTNTAETQTPTFTLGTTQSSNTDDAVVTAFAACDASDTYATGDITDNGTNMNIVCELNARNAPGGALRVAWDIIPDASESYTWSCAYGSGGCDSAGTASININPA